MKSMLSLFIAFALLVGCRSQVIDQRLGQFTGSPSNDDDKFDLLNSSASSALPGVTSSCSAFFSSVSSSITNDQNVPVYVTGNFSVDITYVDNSGIFRTTTEYHSINQILSAFESESFSDSISGDVRSCSTSTSNLSVNYLQPATPTSLKIVNPTENSLTVTWRAGSNGQVATDFFRVDYAQKSAESISASCSGPNSVNVGKALTATLTNLVKGSRYYIAVCAHGNNGQVARNTIKTATIADPSPEVVSLVAHSEGPDNLIASWASGGGSTVDYVYALARGNSVPSTCAGGTVVTTPALTLSGLTANSSYGLRVCSRNINAVASVGIGLSLHTQDPAHITLPFQDNFKTDNKTALNASWRIRAGSFAIKKSTATGEGKGLSIATLNGLSALNSTSQIMVDRTGGFTKDGAGLIARYNFVNGQHRMYVTRVHKVGGKTEIQIIGYFGGAQVVLASSVVGKEDGQLQFVVSESNLKVLLNGELVVSATDNRLPNSGELGVISFGKGEEFDAFRAR